MGGFKDEKKTYRFCPVVYVPAQLLQSLWYRNSSREMDYGR